MSSYCYLVDLMLVGKYAKLLNQIELRATDLGIKGQVIRVDSMTNPGRIIAEQTKNSDVHIIVMGEQDYFTSIVNKITVPGKFVLGYIPVGGGDMRLAGALGIPYGLDACNIIAARRIKSFDVGATNEGTFFSALEVHEPCELQCDEKYLIYGENIESISIKNFFSFNDNGETTSNPCDGVLNIVITTQEESSFFKKKRHRSQCQISHAITINPISQGLMNAIYDGNPKKCEQISITVVPHSLNLIVGKAVAFNN